MYVGPLEIPGVVVTKGVTLPVELVLTLVLLLVVVLVVVVVVLVVVLVVVVGSGCVCELRVNSVDNPPFSERTGPALLPDGVTIGSPVVGNRVVIDGLTEVDEIPREDVVAGTVTVTTLHTSEDATRVGLTDLVPAFAPAPVRLSSSDTADGSIVVFPAEDCEVVRRDTPEGVTIVGRVTSERGELIDWPGWLAVGVPGAVFAIIHNPPAGWEDPTAPFRLHMDSRGL